MNRKYSVGMNKTKWFKGVAGDKSYSVDQRMRYNPALAMALSPVYIQNRTCNVRMSQTPQCGTPYWQTLVRMTAILEGGRNIRLFTWAAAKKERLLTRRTMTPYISVAGIL